MAKESIQERLNQYLSLKNLTNKGFEEICGFSNGLSGKLSEKSRSTTLNRIVEHTDLNPGWLMTGEGEMLRPEAHVSTARMVGSTYNADIRDGSVIAVDFIPVTATASFVESLLCSNDPEFEKLPLVPEGNERNEVDRLCVFEVEGDSMYPTISSGSLILTKEIPPATWQYAEGVVVAVISEFVVVKRIARNRLLTDNYITLRSDNESYGEMTVALADIRALFKAKRIISSPIR